MSAVSRLLPPWFKFELVQGSECSHNSSKTAASSKRSRIHSFEALPLRPDDPPFSAWGLWGSDDELGSLNHLTPETVQAAAREITHGVRVPLNHFDGLRHYPYQEKLQYYNGTTQADITGHNATDRLGVQNIARCGIAGRGVLLDWRRYAMAKGIKYSPFERHAITLAELKAVAKLQQVDFQPGDILLIRTGWVEEYNKLDPKAKSELPDREVRASCGVQASYEMLKWHWDNAFAAVASDTVAYEVWPSPREIGISIHEVFLSGWGMPIGESWDLESLSKTCAAFNKWTFFLTCQPLNIKGGVASPSNALAII
ncbi:hypothetical protein MBLNU13_g10335t1 [Cladosporium sp. NU13]